MSTAEIKNGAIEIIIIDTNETLSALAKKLAEKSEFAFDTEFDRFFREYGFKLFLLQIYDGEKCYLVDPLPITNMQPLWNVFEDSSICKVAYSCTEDIQLLKINGCSTKNIFDLQVAAKLCNHDANSFLDLVAASFNITVDKSMQRSNWRKRPLDMEQQIYASNDVIWLLQLKEIFLATAIERNVFEMLQEENKACEDIVITDYVVKLSAKHNAKYSAYYQEVLLNLFLIRNEIAAAYNLAPFTVVTDATLEEILDSNVAFLQNPFAKGFCRNLLDDEENKQKFFTAIAEIDYTKSKAIQRKERTINADKKIYRDEAKEKVETVCKNINEQVTKKYGPSAAAFILRGLKKSILAKPYAETKLKDYQHKVIDETCEELSIKL